jgi:hypothetical protein
MPNIRYVESGRHEKLNIFDAILAGIETARDVLKNSPTVIDMEKDENGVWKPKTER